MKRTLLAVLILLGVLATGIFAYLQTQSSAVDLTPAPAAEETPFNEQAQQVPIIFDFQDGSAPQQQTVILQEGDTALSILQRGAEQNGSQVVTKQYDFGAFVESINGKVSSAEQAWVYYINGESATVGADQYQVQPGDSFEWKYETAN